MEIFPRQNFRPYFFSQKLRREIFASRRPTYGMAYSFWYQVNILCCKYNRDCTTCQEGLHIVWWCSRIRWIPDKNSLPVHCKPYRMEVDWWQNILRHIFCERILPEYLRSDRNLCVIANSVQQTVFSSSDRLPDFSLLCTSILQCTQLYMIYSCYGKRVL